MAFYFKNVTPSALTNTHYNMNNSCEEVVFHKQFLCVYLDILIYRNIPKALDFLCWGDTKPY